MVSPEYARNNATTSISYSLRGKPDRITDAAGRSLAFQYSPQNYLERIVDPAGDYRYFDYNTLGTLGTLLTFAYLI
jgi:YD repeat-containing protein